MLTKNRLKDKVRTTAFQMTGVAHVYRLAIVYLLASESLEPWQCAQYLGLSKTLVAHHLTMLLKTGWVTKSRQGKRIMYTLNEKAFFTLKELFKNTPFGREAFRV